MSIEKFISPLIASQLPAVYREEGPAFVAFIKAYYEYLEQQTAVLGKSRRLLEYGDIDDTLTEFIDHFLRKYAPDVPSDVEGCRRMLIKHADEIYASKGTEAGLQLLFRIVYNAAAAIKIPGEFILKASAGNWVVPRYLEITQSDLAPLLVGERIVGAESKATAIVEDFVRKSVGSKTVYQLFLSNIEGSFANGERILCDTVYTPTTGPIIVGPMTDLSVVSSGLDYRIGDRLAGIDGTGRGAVAVVTKIGPRAGAVTYDLIDGGSGYTLNANVIITQTGNTAPALVEAQGRVASITNIVPLLIGTDIINSYAGLSLDAAAYGFPQLPTANASTVLDDALDTFALETGSISSIVFAPPGSGYSGNVQIRVVDPMVAPYGIIDPIRLDQMGNNAVLDGSVQIGTGVIEELRVIDSGVGYQDGEFINMVRVTPPVRTDAITVQTHNRTQGYHEGFWRDTDGFLSSDRFLADNDYYQEFSYEVQTAMSLHRYADLVRTMWHPSGMKMFGRAVMNFTVGASIDATLAPITGGANTGGGSANTGGGGSANTGGGGSANTSTNPFDALYSPSFSPVNNTTFYSRPLISSLPGGAAPAKSTSLATVGYIDQRFNTRIYRGTDLADTSTADTSLRHVYARQRAWNADSSRYIVRASNGFWYLYDANTNERLDGGRTNTTGLGALLGFVDQCEATWHPTDPNKIWRTDNLGGLVWYEFDINTKVTTTLFDLGPLLAAIPGFSGAARTWFKNEGRPSDDGNRWALMVETIGNSHIGMIMYDRPSNTILGHLLTTNRPDHISTSPCGQYAVPSWYGAAASSMAAAAAQPISSVSGVRAYDPTFTTFTQLSTLGEHSDLAKDIYGNSVFVSVTYRGGAGGAESDLTDGTLYYRRLDDGIAHELPINVYTNSSDTAVHISGTCSKGKPGWCVVSKYGSTTPTGWHDGVISAVELRPTNPRVLRLAHTQSTVSVYEAEPQAVTNDDLSRVGWATNMQGTQPILFYWLGLPSWTFAQVPVNLTPPSISGTNTIGSTLTATGGTWEGATSTSGQWYRDGVAISGATGTSFTITQNGSHTYVQTATNAQGSSNSTSNAIQVGPLPGATRTPTITAVSTTIGTGLTRTMTLTPTNSETGVDSMLVVVAVDDVGSPYTDVTVEDSLANGWTLIGIINTGDFGGARCTRLFAFFCQPSSFGATTITITQDSASNSMTAAGFVVSDASFDVSPDQLATYAQYVGGAVNYGTVTTSVGNSLAVGIATVYESFGRVNTVQNGWSEPVTFNSSDGSIVPLTVATKAMAGNVSETFSASLAGGGTFVAGLVFRIPGAPL